MYICISIFKCSHCFIFSVSSPKRSRRETENDTIETIEATLQDDEDLALRLLTN